MFEIHSPAGLLGVFNTVDDATFFAVTWMQKNAASTVITNGNRIVSALLCKKELATEEPGATFLGKVTAAVAKLSGLVRTKKRLERQRLRNIRLANELEKERNRTLALQRKLSDLKTYQEPTYSQGGVSLPFST